MATIDDLNQLMLEYEATYWEKLRAARSAESGLVEARFHVSNGNTMVIVFKLKTLIECIRAVSPQTHRGFEQIYHAADSANFEKVVNQVFAQAESFNLSSGFLQMLPLQCERDLVVLPVRGVHWSDWGSEARIMETLGLTGNSSYGHESSSGSFNSLFRRSVADSA